MLKYKFEPLEALKEKGLSSYQLRRGGMLSEGCIQSLRDLRPISWSNIEKLCQLLECQPGDLLEYVPDAEN